MLKFSDLLKKSTIICISKK